MYHVPIALCKTRKSEYRFQHVFFFANGENPGLASYSEGLFELQTLFLLSACIVPYVVVQHKWLLSQIKLHLCIPKPIYQKSIFLSLLFLATKPGYSCPVHHILCVLHLSVKLEWWLCGALSKYTEAIKLPFKRAHSEGRSQTWVFNILP